MYSSSYSRAKFGLESREPLHRSKGKSCSYYMKIIFFFSSLIQSLIIVSLVLFLIYGQPEQSAEEKRVKELEQGFNRLSENNIQLRKDKAQLGAQLGARTAEKAALEKEVANLKVEANNTEHLHKAKLLMCGNTRRLTTPIQAVPAATVNNEVKVLQTHNSQQKAMIALIKSNFTQTVQYLVAERDTALKERDEIAKEVAHLRRQNTLLSEQFTSYNRKCKEDFAQSLNGIDSVIKDFQARIDNLFPTRETFYLSCEKQQDEMKRLSSSCTNLSKDVESKFQRYLDDVGRKVADIQAKRSQLEVLNAHLEAEKQQCEQHLRTETAHTTQLLQLYQRTHQDPPKAGFPNPSAVPGAPQQGR